MGITKSYIKLAIYAKMLYYMQPRGEEYGTY